MTSLFPLAALACALGIAIADFRGIGIALALRVAILALVGGLLSRNRPRQRAACALLAVSACGALAMAIQRAEPRRVPPLDEPRDVVVEAVVCGSDAGGMWLSVDLCDCRIAEADAAAVPRKVRLFESVDGASRHAIDGLRHGERIRARLRLTPIAQASNPGAREQRSAYQRRGIGARATLHDPSMLVRMTSRDAALVDSEKACVKLRDCFVEFRDRIRARLSAAGPGGSLTRALALGDRSGLSNEARDAFAKLGIGHLLAVSGLHLALVAGLAFATARRAVLLHVRLAARHDSRRLALASAFVCAVVYAAMSGWGIPVRRALLFLAVLCMSVAAGRSVNGVQLLSLAAIPVLLYEPNALFEMGAQLSFVASAALLLARSEKDISATGVRALIRTSTTAIVATAPWVAWHAGSAGAYGLVANLLAVPWIGLVVLPASLIAAAAAAAPANAAADFAMRCAARLSEVTLDFTVWLAQSLPSFAEHSHAPAPWAVVLALVISIVALSRARTWQRLALALVQSALLAAAPPAVISPDAPRIVVFDVGQGDAILIQGRSAVLLVDGGRAIEGAVDMGKRVVVPGLAALGVEKIDVVVVSHADIDHRGGLTSVLESFDVAELWLPHGGKSLPDYDSLIETANRHGVHITEKGAGDAIEWVGDLRVQALWPPLIGGPPGRNDKSLVIQVDMSRPGGVVGDRVLLTGDLGAAGEAGLLKRGLDLRSTVLKVGHHGSAGSSTPEFLAAVAPKLALVSAPCHGRGGLPNTKVLERLASAGAEVWWSGQSGAVIVGANTPSQSRSIVGWHTKSKCWTH